MAREQENVLYEIEASKHLAIFYLPEMKYIYGKIQVTNGLNVPLIS